MKFISAHLIHLGLASTLSLLLLLAGSSTAYACDPVGCLGSGKDQDILAIVTVVAVNGKVATVTANHYYKQSRVTPASDFTIDFTHGSPWIQITPTVGKYYFTSLACTDLACTPKWGTWEVNSSDWQTASLLSVDNVDEFMIQQLVNEKTTKYYGIGNRLYTETPDGDYEVYPKYRPYYGPGSENVFYLKTDYLVVLAGLFVGEIVVYFVHRKYAV
ncbi:TPA: hypothetical protein DEP96_02605 [Candidatus Uhrbacteria bacterium]|nr:hypothetical protein [Candidatus Uhrbacteria bacterium]